MPVERNAFLLTLIIIKIRLYEDVTLIAIVGAFNDVSRYSFYVSSIDETINAYFSCYFCFLLFI
jgi:hypothetical protein